MILPDNRDALTFSNHFKHFLIKTTLFNNKEITCYVIVMTHYFMRTITGKNGLIIPIR